MTPLIEMIAPPKQRTDFDISDFLAGGGGVAVHCDNDLDHPVMITVSTIDPEPDLQGALHYYFNTLP